MIQPSILEKADTLARALPFIRKYHGQTMVIKYGGNAMTDPALQAAFAQDVVLLKLVGINPVVVHGGGPQIESALQRLGKTGSFIQGMRVTDAETMGVVEWVLAGQVQQEIVGLITQAGGKAVGLTGRDGGMIRAKKLQMLDHADVVAAKLATVLQAEKLLMLTNISGVLNKAGELLTELSPSQIDAMVEDGSISGGMLPKISGALDAAKTGVKAVHIIDGRIPHVLLLEILSDQAFGTMIRSS